MKQRFASHRLLRDEVGSLIISLAFGLTLFHRNFSVVVFLRGL